MTQNLEPTLTKKIMLSKYLSYMFFTNWEPRDYISENKPQCTEVSSQSNLQICQNSFYIPRGGLCTFIDFLNSLNHMMQMYQVLDLFSA